MERIIEAIKRNFRPSHVLTIAALIIAFVPELLNGLAAVGSVPPKNVVLILLVVVSFCKSLQGMLKGAAPNDVTPADTVERDGAGLDISAVPATPEVVRFALPPVDRDKAKSTAMSAGAFTRPPGGDPDGGAG